MNISKNIAVKSTTHQKPIVTDVFYKVNNQPKPIVIFCHGYKGYKDWGAWNLAAEYFAENDFFFVKFNFSHNGGTIENPIDFPDLEAFGQNNFIIELDDLEDVINWVTHNNSFSNEIDKNNITLIGHSRGGGIVTIKAAENKKVKHLITWSGVSDFGSRFPKSKELENWKEKGVAYILNGRTHQQMPHYYQFYEVFKQNEERLTIKNATKKLVIPHLIIHGTNDKVVLPIEAEHLHDWSSNSQLHFIKNMDHPLGCSQPWENESMPKHLATAVKLSSEFITQSYS